MPSYTPDRYTQAVAATLTHVEHTQLAWDAATTSQAAQAFQAGDYAPSPPHRQRLIATGRYPAYAALEHAIVYRRYPERFASALKASPLRPGAGDTLKQVTGRTGPTVTGWFAQRALPDATTLQAIIMGTGNLDLYDAYISTIETVFPLNRAQSLFRRVRIALGVNQGPHLRAATGLSGAALARYEQPGHYIRLDEVRPIIGTLIRTCAPDLPDDYMVGAALTDMSETIRLPATLEALLDAPPPAPRTTIDTGDQALQDRLVAAANTPTASLTPGVPSASQTAPDAAQADPRDIPAGPTGTRGGSGGESQRQPGETRVLTGVAAPPRKPDAPAPPAPPKPSRTPSSGGGEKKPKRRTRRAMKPAPQNPPELTVDPAIMTIIDTYPPARDLDPGLVWDTDYAPVDLALDAAYRQVSAQLAADYAKQARLRKQQLPVGIAAPLWQAVLAGQTYLPVRCLPQFAPAHQAWQAAFARLLTAAWANLTPLSKGVA